MTVSKLTVSTLAVLAMAGAAEARDNLQVAGSSTVLPYSTIVAESFSENFDFPTPVVEGGGSGAGRKKLCEGLGETTIDIANSSSRIKQSEIDECRKNGVTEIMEVQIGYDGIVFATAVDNVDYALTPKDIFLAVSTEIAKDGELTDNTLKSWKEVNEALPDQPVLIFIPGTKHSTREVFNIKIMLEGCKKTGAYDLHLAASASADAETKRKDAETACFETRTDGTSVDIDGDYTETLARMGGNPTAMGVFGLSFYENNTDRLKVATMSGVVPSVETISSGDYPVSRPLYFYVKKQHIGVIPGLKEYVEFFLSDDMVGPEGELTQYGLVPDPELAATQAAVAKETIIRPPE